MTVKVKTVTMGFDQLTLWQRVQLALLVLRGEPVSFEGEGEAEPARAPRTGHFGPTPGPSDLN